MKITELAQEAAIREVQNSRMADNSQRQDAGFYVQTAMQSHVSLIEAAIEYIESCCRTEYDPEKPAFELTPCPDGLTNWTIEEELLGMLREAMK